MQKKLALSLVLIVTIPGAVVSLAIIKTTIDWSDKVSQCSQQNNTHRVFVRNMYIGIDILRFLSCLLLTWGIIYALYFSENDEKRIASEQMSQWHRRGNKSLLRNVCDFLLYVILQTILSALLIAFTFVIVIEGYERDIENRNSCGIESSQINTLIFVHTTLKFLVYFTGALNTIIAFSVSIPAIVKWKVAMHEISDASFGTNDTVQIYADKKSYHLSQQYQRVGNCTRFTQNALSQWFCIQYLRYWLAIITTLVSIARKDYSEKESKHAEYVLVYNLLAFVVSYITGIFLNHVHQDYYKNLNREYTMFRLHSGNDATNTNTSKEHKTYHSIIMGKEINKKSEFDFIPTFFYVAIPVDSPGYTFSIVLSFVAAVFQNV